MNRGETILKSPVLAWAGLSLLYSALSALFYMIDYAITQPHPVYCGGESWIRYVWQEALQVAWLPGAIMAVLIPIDLVVQRFRGVAPFDMRYRPTAVGLKVAIGQRWPRLILISGTLLMLGYGGFVGVLMWGENQRPHGLIWGPHWLYALLLFAWAVIWVADALTRSRKTTLAAAALYLLCIALLAFALGTVILVE